jgi:hypothetical protein
MEDDGTEYGEELQAGNRGTGGFSQQGEPWRIVQVLSRGTYPGSRPQGQLAPSHRVPGRVEVRCVFGRVSLDLRELVVPPEGSEVDVLAVCSFVHIVVPYGVNVLHKGRGVGGVFGGNARYARGFLGPTVRISGVAALGNVRVSVRQ